MIQKLLLIGGDRRALELEKRLKEDGFLVDTLGLHSDDERTADFKSAQAVLLAYPFSVRDGCIPALNGLTIHPEDVLEKLNPGTLVLAGRGLAQEWAQHCFVRYYMEDERLEQRNAEISAEAAVLEAMQRTGTALMDMKVLITGYGRFGRALARKLHALGAEVWAAARREEQLRIAAGDDMRVIALGEMHKVLPQMHMVFNTVPAQVMGERELTALAQGSWLLELASAPYGFDRQKAQECGIQCEVLPALPARYAPGSAGMALEETAVRLIREAEA